MDEEARAKGLLLINQVSYEAFWIEKAQQRVIGRQIQRYHPRGEVIGDRNISPEAYLQSAQTIVAIVLHG
jgi:hypothetical protein